MQSQWNSKDARSLGDDPRETRVYASGLLANAGPAIAAFSTVKIEARSLRDEVHTQLYASAGDSIVLLEETAALPPEARLHAAIPARFVDGVRSAALIALANHSEAESLAQTVFGDRVAIVPFQAQARDQARLIRESNIGRSGALLVPGTGLLSFSDDARTAYEQALELQELASGFLAKKADSSSDENVAELDPREFARLRKTVSSKSGQAVVAKWDASAAAMAAASMDTLSLSVYATDGDHEETLPDETDIQRVLWEGQGVFSFGTSKATAERIAQDTRLTCQAMELANGAGGWNPAVDDPFAQSALGTQSPGPLQGQIALVSGSAAGIGLAAATTLAEAGATVIGADINPEIGSIMDHIGALGVTVDLTQESQIEALINRIVLDYGGLDIVVSNAGIFTAGAYLEDMEPSNWERSMAVNLTSHQVLMKHAIPFVKEGINPSIIFIGSRNVNAPGAGAASYSCAKAGLTQLCRVAALELAPEGVRVNIIHPDAVFDTKLWTQEALERSAERYGLTVEQYKKRNLMKTEITSRSVGHSVVALASQAFAKTTGAQIPVDGGNDRII